MKYCSTETFFSKLAPTLVYTLHKMSHGRRVVLNQLMAPHVAKLQEVTRERIPLLEECRQIDETTKISPCTCTHPIDPEKDPHVPNTNACTVEGCNCRLPQYELATIQKLNELRYRADLIEDELKPTYVQWGVKNVNGLEIDGKPITVETITDLPPALVDEVVTEIRRLTQMTTEETLAFGQPTTSSAQVGGQTTSTNAPNAKA